MRTSDRFHFKGSPWAIHPPALKSLLAQLEQPRETRDAGWVDEMLSRAKRSLVIDHGAAIIPVRGVLLREEEEALWLRGYWEVEATAYSEIKAQVIEALDTEGVDRILLDVFSPGGYVGGLMDAARQVWEASHAMPVTAHITEMGASAAYWLASQAQHVTADEDAEVGSIGVFSVVTDSSARAEQMGLKVHIVRSGPVKGMAYGAPISDEQIAVEQAVVDGIAEQFVSAVARGRGMASKEVKALATGAYWLAGEAMKQGLVDGLSRLDDAKKGGGVKRQRTKGGHTMAEETKQETPPAVDVEAVKAEAAAEGAKLAQERLASLEAAFPNHAAFAREQWVLGHGVDDAKRAHYDVVVKELAESQKEVAALRSKAESAAKAAKEAQEAAAAAAEDGTDALKFGEGSGGSAPGDFMAAVDALSKAEGISKTDAMRRVSKEQPELRAAYLGK